ncbi:MAG TPA: CHAT domain-containing tetratricopeptide repeat protein [Polyangia bacterium]|nr:CHAT domain-containing tetratricopeptide repeat protein [Polyangia bacterium]
MDRALRWVVAAAICLGPGAVRGEGKPKTATAAQQAEILRLQQQLNAAQAKQDYATSIPVARKLWEVERAASGEDSRPARAREQILANLLQGAGRYPESLAMFEKMLKRAEAETGPVSRDTQQALASVSSVYWAQSRYDELLPLEKRKLEISRKVDGERSQMYAGELATLGSLYNLRSEFSAAERCFAQSLEIEEAIPANKNSLALLGGIQTLAYFYWMTNQQPKAIALWDRAIALSQTAPNTNVLVQGSTLWGIASQYHYGGRDDLATPLTKRAVELYEQDVARREKATPPDPQLPTLLGQLGFVYRQTGDLPRAEATLTRAVEAGRQTGFSGWESQLADIKRAQGKHQEALELLEHAKTLITKLSPMSATVYDLSIADLLREMGDTARARKVIEEERQWVATRYGTRHPLYGQVLLAQSRVYAAAGEIREAERALTDALELAERELSIVLRAGTESDHAVYFARNGYQLNTAINFQIHYAPRSAGALRLGLTTLLRRKGRVLDAAAASLATLRAKLSPEDRKLLDELGAARAELAKLTVAGPPSTGGDDYTKQIAALEDKLQKIELALSAKSAAYRTVSQPIELPAVQKAIPRDARLVELVSYQPADPKAPYALNPVLAPRRYAAYVVGAHGDPAFVDLGESGPIDEAIASFRKAVSNPDDDRAGELGHALYRLTMAKVIPLLGGATNVLLAPDGALNLVPFSALVDDAGQFLIKKYTFTYPTSGRDLLRMKAQTKAQGGGLIFADPSFDAAGPAAPAADPGGDGQSRGRRSLDLATVSWPRLPGTSQEAEEVSRTMPGLKVLRGDEATEGALKRSRGPRILHLATHGFFLPDEPPPPRSADDAAPALAPGAASPPPPPHENPLLRSGLALAGANKLRSGDEDGILTALEASGLDLGGTKLVVLSACETGVGKVTNGEGVYGLRRALVIAGAESLVMTLWQVDDLATRDLMAGYYARLEKGAGRSSALRDTQLAIAARPKYAHPYFWASFLAAGADSPINKD